MEDSKSASSGALSDPASDEGPRLSVSDQPTKADSLGFRPYVQALGEFLVNSQTEPPLTISIEGEWGSGKSSFMMQLADELDRLGRGGLLQRFISFFVGRRTSIVWFNAWRHDKVDSVYAGFAIRFLEEIRKKSPALRRIFAIVYLWLKRFDWSLGGFLAFARIITLWLFSFRLRVSSQLAVYRLCTMFGTVSNEPQKKWRPGVLLRARILGLTL
jgi:KAP family P-loop domain